LPAGYFQVLEDRGVEERWLATRGVRRARCPSIGAVDVRVALSVQALRREFLENLGMALGDLKQRFCRTRGFPPPLLPIL